MNLSGFLSVSIKYYLLGVRHIELFSLISRKLCGTDRVSTFARDAWDATRTYDRRPDWTPLPLEYKHGRFNITDVLTC